VRTRFLAAAATLVVAVSALVLARVALNRSGRHADVVWCPDPTLTFTERELPVVPVDAREESSGASLRFSTEHFVPWRSGPEGRMDLLGWLDERKLAELGFDVALPADGDEARSKVGRQRSRRAWAVLEYEGAAWESYRSALATRYGLDERGVPRPGFTLSRDDGEGDQKDASSAVRHGSRLFVVDAGLDECALRARFPAPNALVVPVKVAAWVDVTPGAACVPATCRVRGAIELLVDEVTVPRRFHGALPPGGSYPATSYGAPAEIEPRYEVVLRNGSRREPWIEDLRPLPAAGRDSGAQRR
jgi:hypothetical protein